MISFIMDDWSSLYNYRYAFIEVLISIMYIYIYSSNINKRIKIIMVIPALVLVLVVFNPFIIRMLLDNGQIYEYKRMLWVFPTNQIIACAVTILMVEHKEWWKRVWIIVTVFLISVCTLDNYNGVWFWKDFVKADNTLHIQQETVEVADIIMNDGRISKMAAMPDELCLDIRSYEPRIKLLNSYKGYEYYYGDEYEKDQDLMYYQINMAETPDVKKTGEWLRMYDFVYVVWDKGKVDKSDMEAVLFELIAETEHYEIYAVRKELLI